MAKEKKSWFSAKAKGAARGEIAIMNDIGAWGVTQQDFFDGLNSLGPVTDLDVFISSDGGDVSTGFAIYDMLNRHEANKVVRVMGLAASMASVIAMAGDEVVMPGNAMLMIHNPWGGVMGESKEIKSFAAALDMMQANIQDAYVKRTGMDAADVAEMMDVETWLTADKALKLGFADRVEDPIEIAARYNLAKFNKVPKLFGAYSKEKTMTTQNDAANNGNDAAAGTGAAADESKALRDAFVATTKEIRSLCKLAGKADLADKFIEDGKSVSEVIDALGKLRVDGSKDENADVSARHNANNTVQPKPVDSTTIYGRFNHAKKRTA
jgi:ATP-dependent Clp protease protease subunit